MARIEIPCNFVGSFKVGDNLVYNSNLLCDLVEANADSKFNKPCVLQAGAILEAALSQIIYRAQNYNLEGVPNISEEDRLKIEGEKIDVFFNVLQVLEKYHILNALGVAVYDDLHRLRKFRNKVHIQERIQIEGVSLDEGAAFSDEIYAWALDLNLRVIQHLSDNFPRPGHVGGYVGSLSLPQL